ncbi:MAG: hypothetical protein NC177_11540 [Ruminococcus flavefaciens]|nr:hypothetical protein [Ruminococcus flavefaciens]
MIFVPVTEVIPLSPPAITVPPEISTVVSACTASFPALILTRPSCTATLPFEDLRPSPSASILRVPLFTVMDFLPFTPSVLSVELRVVMVTIPPLNLMSLLQTIPS